MPAFGSTDHPSMQRPSSTAGGVRCPRCGQMNPPGERRCSRCQSRLTPAPVQQRLDLRGEWPKVVSIDWIAPERFAKPAAAARRAPARRAPRRKPSPPGQLWLDLQPLPALPVAERPVDRPELPPAPLARRFLSALLDALFISLAFGIVLTVAGLRGVPFSLAPQFSTVYAIVLAGLGLVYKAIFVAVNCDSPGLRLAGLRLLRFDRRPPGWRDRWIRLLSACVTTSGLGAGVIWAALSREQHTWYDLISRTCVVERVQDPPRP